MTKRQKKIIQAIVAYIDNGIVNTIRAIPQDNANVLIVGINSQKIPPSTFPVDITNLKRVDGTNIQVLDVYDVENKTFNAPID
jgi:hypothetical protein